MESRNGSELNASTKQVAILQLGDSASCMIGCQAENIHSKDWIGLYENSLKSDNSYMTWQYASKCCYDVSTGKQAYYNTGKAFKNRYEARYMKYNESTGNYDRMAVTGSLPRANNGISFTHMYHPGCWIALDHSDGVFVISYKLLIKQSYDWIGIYKDKGKKDTEYETYYWVTSSASPITTSIKVQEGYQIRFFSGTGRYTYSLVASTEPFPSIGVSTAAMGCPRRPTSLEITGLQNSFPSLSSKDLLITDEPTARYNCIAWSLGFTNRWINPAQTIRAFEAQYTKSGCIGYTALSSSASIDAWAKTNGTVPTHGSKKYQNSRWESKCGKNFRITHGREELKTPSLYGEVVSSFSSPGFKLGDLTDKEGLVINPEETEKVLSAVSNVSDETKRRFEELYGIWQYSINGYPFQLSSDTADYKNADGFEDMVRVGAEIIPLVIEKLMDEEQYMAVVLYEELQEVNDMKLLYSESNSVETLLEGEQARAKRIVKSWVENA